MLALVTLAALGSSFAGCVESNGYRSPLPAEEYGTSRGDDGTGERACRPDECGASGVRGAEHLFGDIDLDGWQNAHGFAVIDFLDRRGEHAVLDVVDEHLIGRADASGVVVRADRQLVGSEIILQETWSDGASSEWQLVIDEVSLSADGHRPRYRISYRAIGASQPRMPLCQTGWAVAHRGRATGRELVLACGAP